MRERTKVTRPLSALEAANGLSALECLTRDGAAVRLVITDVVMPGMGGRELAERLARFRPELPVLFTSGYTDGEIVRRGLLEPGAAFVQKPFTPDGIVRSVRERLDAASLR